MKEGARKRDSSSSWFLTDRSCLLTSLPLTHSLLLFTFSVILLGLMMMTIRFHTLRPHKHAHTHSGTLKIRSILTTSHEHTHTFVYKPTAKCSHSKTTAIHICTVCIFGSNQNTHFQTKERNS